MSARAMSRFGARRSASGMLVARERRMSSAVMTKTDAGASDSRSSRRDTEVTTTLANCSSDRSASSDADAGIDALASPAAQTQSAIVATGTNHRTTALRHDTVSLQHAYAGAERSNAV